MDLVTTQQAPSYAKLIETVRSRIGSGEWIPGEKVPSVRSLARQFGISQATVSHACAELIREGLLRSERGRGMFVSEPRARLPIGLMSPLRLDAAERPGSFGGAFLRGVQEALRERGRRLAALGDVRTESYTAAHLRRIGGAIIYQTFSADEIVGFKRYGLPFVVADLDFGLAGVDSAATDNAGGMARVVRELHARGARRLTYLHAPRTTRKQWDPALDERLDGFRLAAMALGLDTEIVTPTQRSQAGGREVAERLLPSPLPDALVCYGDEAACGALEVLAVRGVRVPEALQVTGFGRVAGLDAGTHQLATVGFDAAAMGRAAVGMLLERLADPAAPVRRLRVPGEWQPGTTVRKLDRRSP